MISPLFRMSGAIAAPAARLAAGLLWTIVSLVALVATTIRDAVRVLRESAPQSAAPSSRRATPGGAFDATRY